jgi:hypothetical protein
MARFSARTVLLHITLVVVGVSFSLANEVIAIGTILKNPESYYLHAVTLKGTVGEVKLLPLPPDSILRSCAFEGFAGTFYNPMTFTLEDETGSIGVDRLAICGPEGLKVPEVTEGDEVIIEAEIRGPDQDSQRRMVIPGVRPTTHAVVRNIRRP